MVDFVRPAFLVLVAVLPWFWWQARHARRPLRRGTIATRLVVALLLVLAAAGLQVGIRDGDMDVIYAIDRSNSIDTRAQQRAVSLINEWTGTMQRYDRAGAVVFGGDAVLERHLAERLRIAEITSMVSPSATNIADALATARAALPPSGARRVVLMSDGCETSGAALDEAAFAAADGVPIDVVRDAGPSGGMLRTARVVTPETVREGEPFRVSVEILGRPGGTGDVIVRRDGLPFLERQVLIAPDGTTRITITDSHDVPGLHVYRASARDELDPAFEERTSDPGATVAVEGIPTVLFVTTGRSIQSALGAGGFSVTDVNPSGLPDSTAALARYDAVILDDIASEQLTDRQAAAIRRYVEEAGGGLLLLGSPHSLGAAGHPSGPLGEILPVDLRPRSGRRAPAVALAFVFDKSGSMADVADGVPKIELARTAALKILDVVPPTDPVGVIAFDAKPTIVAPMAASQSRAALAERLRTLSAGGSTAISPAVELALDWLSTTPQTVARRHLLLLSDGRTAAPDMERLRVLLQGKGVELSVVAIGADADRTALEQLARSTGGRAFFPSDLRQLPLIVTREAARSAGGGTVEESFTPRAQSHPALQGIDGGDLPRLGGYVVSAGKPGSEPLLLSHLDDPVLSAWQAGLGRVAVYTADLGAGWSADLASWSGAPRLWSQVVRWLHRRVNHEALTARLSETDEGARLTVEAEDSSGRFNSRMNVRAQVRPPEGESFEVVLEPSAPGRYEAAVPMGPNGPYALSIVARGGDHNTGDQQMLRGFYWTGEREQRGCVGGGATLQRIAELTGGRMLEGSASPFNGPRLASLVDVSTWLAGAALLLFFVDLTGAALRGLLSYPWRRNAPPDASPDRQAA